MAGDWLKLYRSILDSSVFADDWHCRLFIWCLCKANYMQSRFRGQVLTRGEFITGRISGADELNVSPSKFYRGLHALQEQGCIAIKANSNWTTVTVCNYETYQYSDEEDEQQMNSQRTANEQQMNTDKEFQEGKNGRREEPSLPEILDTDQFKARLSDWLAYKAERRETYKPMGLRMMLSRAATLAKSHGLLAVMSAMEKAMGNSWKGWEQENSFAVEPDGTEDRVATKADAWEAGYKGTDE